MRRPYLTSDRLRLRFPMPHPQLDIGSLGPGEPAVVQNPASSSPEDDVAPQDDAPQNVQLVPSATQPATSASSSDRAIPGQSTHTGSTTSLGSTEAFTSTSAQFASATGLSNVTSSLTTSLASLASPTTTTAASSSMYTLSLSSSVSSATPSASSSESVPPVSSSITPSRASASASSSASPSTTSAAVGPQGIGHDAAFYAGVALGVFILIACLATIIACLVRFRTRRREAAAIAAIAWDPVVAKPSSLELDPDFSLTGDRDVGEPKRSDSFLGDDLTSANAPPYYTNPFVETAYYSPHQVPSLVDSAAYPLPPRARPSLTIPLSNSGPYPTARPLPAHLADRDPHRLARTSGSASASARSSRSGSVRSHLPSASTLCVANGDASRASTALGMCAEHAEDGRNDMAGGGGQRAHEHQQGPLRGVNVPWRQRRESFARRAPGGTPGWVRMPAPPSMEPHEGQGQGEGWTSTLRASVMGALHAVTGVGAPREEGDDGLTRAPSMQRERREEGMGWQRRFAREEGEWEQGSGYALSRSSASTPYVPNGYLGPPPLAALQLSHGTSGTATDDDEDGMSLRTENARVPLVARPRPAAVVSRASSVYSSAGYGEGEGYFSHV